MHTIATRPENRRRDTTPVLWDASTPWARSEAFAEDLEEPAAAPRHNPRPYWKGSDGVLEPVLEPIGRAAWHGLAGLFGQRLGGARA